MVFVILVSFFFVFRASGLINFERKLFLGKICIWCVVSAWLYKVSEKLRAIYLWKAKIFSVGRFILALVSGFVCWKRKKLFIKLCTGNWCELLNNHKNSMISKASCDTKLKTATSFSHIKFSGSSYFGLNLCAQFN